MLVVCSLKIRAITTHIRIPIEIKARFEMGWGVAYILFSLNNAHSDFEGVGEGDKAVLSRPTEGVPFAGRQ